MSANRCFLTNGIHFYVRKSGIFIARKWQPLRIKPSKNTLHILFEITVIFKYSPCSRWYFKCYTIAADFLPLHVADRTDLRDKWRVFCQPTERMIVMTRYALDVVSYAPLYIHSFRLVQPHTLVEAEKFNLIYTDPTQIDNIADKLRWYRYQHGLLQRDVADYAGLDRSTYSGYENTRRDYYPIEKMEKIAELFAVPVTDLLDEFNLFLYNGQGRQIKEMRRRRQMTQVEYARRLGVPFGTLQGWEQDRVQICKQTWRRLKIRG